MKGTRSLGARKRALTRHAMCQMCQSLDLGLPRLQDGEKCVFVTQASQPIVFLLQQPERTQTDLVTMGRPLNQTQETLPRTPGPHGPSQVRPLLLVLYESPGEPFYPFRTV